MDANNIQSIKAYIKQFENLQDYKIGQDYSKFEVDTAQTLCANKYKTGKKKNCFPWEGITKESSNLLYQTRIKRKQSTISNYQICSLYKHLKYTQILDLLICI